MTHYVELNAQIHGIDEHHDHVARKLLEMIIKQYGLKYDDVDVEVMSYAGEEAHEEWAGEQWVKSRDRK